MPSTSLMSFSNTTIAEGIKSDFVGFYFGLMSADSIESRVTIAQIGIGNCYGEFM